MAILKVCILKNGRVVPYAAPIEPLASRTASWDTDRECEVDPAGMPVQGFPEPPDDLPVLPGPSADLERGGQEDPHDGRETGAGSATDEAGAAALAALKGKQALREYAIAEFGIELPARATEAELRSRILALHRARQGGSEPADDEAAAAGDAQP